jgi:hypothetical protein
MTEKKVLKDMPNFILLSMASTLAYFDPKIDKTVN